MQTKSAPSHWYKKLWKILSNPTFDVIAAMVLVIFAAWIVIHIESEEKRPAFPVLFGNK